jgi:hypothetical protein
MTTSSKRDNAYYAARLKKDGYKELLEKVELGKLSMYKAAQEAGYRSKQPPSPAEKLSYHWKRASYAERFKFVLLNLKSVSSIGRDVTDELTKRKAQKTNQ